MASWGRAHAIKAALLAGFLLILLNLIGPRWEYKIIKAAPINNTPHTNSLQWPKRTRTSSEVIVHNNYNSYQASKQHSKSSQENSHLPSAQNLTNISTNNRDNSTSKTNNSTNTATNINMKKIIHSLMQNHTVAASAIVVAMTKVQSDVDADNIPISNASSTESTIPNKTVNNSPVNNSSHNLTIIKNELAEHLNSSQNAIKTNTKDLCPPIPPNLDGPFAVDTAFETLAAVEAKLGPKLKPGGYFEPSECKARDRVAIVVPYRDREHHLPIFLRNLHIFLMKQQIDYDIFIVEQSSGGLFNRATLMNIGFVEALKLSNWNCFIFHDVDLLPMDDRNLYTCPDQPRHMSVAVDKLGFKLPYNTIFGGVSAMTIQQFKTVNGFSNSFWGWGGEDDDMSNRLKHVGFHIARYPVNIARYTMLNHKKEKANPRRYEKLVTGPKRFSSDGLNSLKYTVLSVVKKPLFTWIHVDINQDNGS